MMMEAGISVFTPDHSEVYAVTCLPRPSGPATIFGVARSGREVLEVRAREWTVPKETHFSRPFPPRRPRLPFIRSHSAHRRGLSLLPPLFSPSSVAAVLSDGGGPVGPGGERQHTSAPSPGQDERCERGSRSPSCPVPHSGWLKSHAAPPTSWNGSSQASQVPPSLRRERGFV